MPGRSRRHQVVREPHDPRAPRSGNGRRLRCSTTPNCELRVRAEPVGVLLCVVRTTRHRVPVACCFLCKKGRVLHQGRDRTCSWPQTRTEWIDILVADSLVKLPAPAACLFSVLSHTPLRCCRPTCLLLRLFACALHVASTDCHTAPLAMLL
jgi:hypothetical protein